MRGSRRVGGSSYFASHQTNNTMTTRFVFVMMMKKRGY